MSQAYGSLTDAARTGKTRDLARTDRLVDDLRHSAQLLNSLLALS